MQTRQKYAGRFADTVGDDCSLCPFEIKRDADKIYETSSSFSASGTNSAVGKPQCPSSIASVSA